MSSGKKNPRDVKIDLAFQFVERFHSKTEAEKAKADFFEIFSNKGMPSDIAEWQTIPQADVWICKLLHDAGLTASTSEGKRLVEGGGVERDGEKIQDSKLKLNLKSGEKFTLKAGKKKFVKVIVK